MTSKPSKSKKPQQNIFSKTLKTDEINRNPIVNRTRIRTRAHTLSPQYFYEFMGIKYFVALFLHTYDLDCYLTTQKKRFTVRTKHATVFHRCKIVLDIFSKKKSHIDISFDNFFFLKSTWSLAAHPSLYRATRGKILILAHNTYFLNF